ncbi:MAG: ATP-binding cassette domain-containing protein, partial [Oscillospiraceae bacterium]
MSIEVKDLSFAYGEHEVLHGVSFKAKAGEFLSILGPNGVGKSTLFRCVLG